MALLKTYQTFYINIILIKTYIFSRFKFLNYCISEVDIYDFSYKKNEIYTYFSVFFI